MASINYVASTTQLNKELSDILEKVIDAVSKTLLKDFRQHLDATIYAAPKGDYVRNRENGGFYAGWEIKKDQSSALKGYIRRLAFDGGNLVAPSDYNGWAHGGKWGGSPGGDQRGKMSWILNDVTFNGLYSYAGGAHYLENNDGYWNTYLAGIDDKIDKWLNKEFKKYGIVRR